MIDLQARNTQTSTGEYTATRRVEITYHHDGVTLQTLTTGGNTVTIKISRLDLRDLLNAVNTRWEGQLTRRISMLEQRLPK